MGHVVKARVVVLACAVVGIVVLSGCTSSDSGEPEVDPGAAASTAAVSVAAEQSAAQRLAADQAAEAQAATDKAAADKAVEDKLAADQAAAQAAAEQAEAEQAAAQAVADQAAAEQAAAQAVADQAAADQAAAEQAAANQAAAEQAAADEAEEAESGLTGWYTPNGNWVSPETAARALAAGIDQGDTVPNYLRCGSICGEGPTSGEVQSARACQEGTVPAAECVGTDPAEIIAAASGYSGW
ncbi:MAG: hypothetical protein ABWZ98_06950 [Nakamurella sp.]